MLRRIYNPRNGRGESDYNDRLGGPLLHIFILLVSVLALAQPASKIQQAQCGLEKDCRINIITSRKTIDAQCTGKLFGELNCEMRLKANSTDAELILLCRDSKLAPHLEATVLVDFYSYRVSRILKKNGTDKLTLDPKFYYSFNHPAFRATISREKEILSGDIELVINKDAYKMDEVECTSSESAPSSDGPVQIESQS